MIMQTVNINSYNNFVPQPGKTKGSYTRAKLVKKFFINLASGS